mgnify:CR=1 FL=1
MKNKTSHEESILALKRIEGQVRGVQGMIEQKRYCIEILTQLHSVMGAIARVEDDIFRKHLKGCVAGTMKTGTESDQNKKIAELMDVLKKFRK